MDAYLSALKERVGSAWAAQKALLDATLEEKRELSPEEREQIERMDGATIVTNPPYGLRIGKRDAMPEFVRGLGDFLKHRCAGSSAFVYFGNRELLKSLGLRPTWKKPLANGGLDGRLVRLDLFAGSRDAFEVARRRDDVRE